MTEERHIIHVVGARPNFMKAAPVVRAIGHYGEVVQHLVHTGQHYDQNMSNVFFSHLGLPKPDVNLGVGPGSHAAQTARIMERFEQVVLAQKPDWVVVYGDVNSTVAAALVCAKLGVPVAHVEAGLRSFDRQMPEEINRLVTDQLSDLLFTPSEDGDHNLQREGIPPARICQVGNTMIDSLVQLLPEAERRWGMAKTHADVPGLERNTYVLVTLHRPSNVDDLAGLGEFMRVLSEISRNVPVIFPVHPRTRSQLQKVGRPPAAAGVHLTEPLGYIDFLALQRFAKVVITDSGGVQEETTFLNVPCLTCRENTERPVTVTVGTNRVVGRDPAVLEDEVRRILQGDVKVGGRPPLWDGRAGERIARRLCQA